MPEIFYSGAGVQRACAAKCLLRNFLEDYLAYLQNFWKLESF